MKLKFLKIKPLYISNMSKTSKTQKSSETSEPTEFKAIYSSDRKSFDVDRLKIGEIDTDKNGEVYMANIKYSYDGSTHKGPLIIITDSIINNKGGIPSLDGSTRQTDSQREYICILHMILNKKHVMIYFTFLVKLMVK